MQFEVLFQELAGGVEVIRALVALVTAEEARPRPISELYQSERWVALSQMESAKIESFSKEMVQ